MDPTDIPILSGDRLTLEPLVAAHAPALFALLADDELWRFTDDRAPRSIDLLRERYRRLETRRSPNGTHLWLNWAVATSRYGHVGFVQATLDAQLQEAQIAYVIARQYWSLGLGTEAVRLLLSFLANSLRVQRACANVDSANLASLALLKKLEFQVVDDTDGRNCRLEFMLRSTSDRQA